MRQAMAFGVLGPVLAISAADCLTGDLGRKEARGLTQPGSGDGVAFPESFPYRVGAAPAVPWYARHRAERRSPLVCAFRAVDYLLKYERKHRGASAEALEYFAWQREMLGHLAAERTDVADVSLALVGDLMWLQSDWRDFLAPEVLEYLNGHDMVIGNLETVVAHSFGVPRLLHEPAILRYNSRPELVTSFRRPDGRNTFTALTLANNHAMDYGRRGASETAAFLSEQGILHTGTRIDRAAPDYVDFSARGIRVGLCAATWGLSNRVELISEVRQVASLAPLPGEPLDIGPIRAALDAMGRAGVDFRIAAVHWGFEYELYPDPTVMQVARQIVRAGADLVVGTHPHVVQPAEICFLNGYERRYAAATAGPPCLPLPQGSLLGDGSDQQRKALVLYSLGNFTTAMGTFLCRTGAIQSLRLRRDPATGRVDWFAPRTRLSYNVPRDRISGGRRLVLLSSRLAAGHADSLSRRDREDLQLLHRIVPGE